MEVYRVEDKENGMLVVINTRDDGQYAVALIDADADEVAALRIYPVTMLEQAKAYANTLV